MEHLGCIDPGESTCSYPRENKSMGHKSCIEGNFNPSNPHREKPPSFCSRMFMAIDQKSVARSFEKSKNKWIVWDTSKGTVTFLGNTPKLNHPTCMIFTTFSYITDGVFVFYWHLHLQDHYSTDSGLYAR